MMKKAFSILLSLTIICACNNASDKTNNLTDSSNSIKLPKNRSSDSIVTGSTGKSDSASGKKNK